MDNWVHLTDGYERPKKRFEAAPSSRQKPAQKPVPPVKILPNLAGLRTDEQYADFLRANKNETVVVNFGSSWCDHCHQMLPHFLTLTSAFPRLKYAVAQVDFMVAAAKGVTYTPTFSVFKRGRTVDSFYGSNQQQLRDHLWLHTD